MLALGGIGDRVGDRQVLLGGDRETVADVGEPSCHLQVQAASVSAVERLEDGLTETVVAEPERLKCPCFHNEDTCPKRRPDLVIDQVFAMADGSVEDVRLDAAAEAGHALDQLSRRGWERSYACRE